MTICAGPADYTCVRSVEGTDVLVLELEMFGFAFASRFILLRSTSLTIIDKLRDRDPAVMAAIAGGGSRLGRVIKDSELVFNDQDQCLYLKLVEDPEEPSRL